MLAHTHTHTAPGGEDCDVLIAAAAGPSDAVGMKTAADTRRLQDCGGAEEKPAANYTRPTFTAKLIHISAELFSKKIASQKSGGRRGVGRGGVARAGVC